ncbi:MAG TPA: ABC transporter permease [Ilumatobacteraceae bacterium]|nr:ABC transporter permease [Ilumatobacteraceae bacterium]
MSSPAEMTDVQSGESRARHRWRRLTENKLNLLTMLLLVALVCVAVFSDLIAPFSATKPAGMPISLPSWDHLLGTDEIGRDVFSRVIHGTRISLYVGLGATTIALLIGVPLGMISGYFGRFTDGVIMRLVDGMLAFPPIILAMATVAVLGPNLRNTIIAIGVVQVPRFARQARAVASSMREREFVQASRALGGSHLHVMARALLPNMAPVITVQATLTFATAVLTEAALSFLGLGAQPPTASWGAMLNTGKTLLSLNPWIAVGSGMAIFVTVLLFTLLGDTLTDLLNPYRIER